MVGYRHLKVVMREPVALLLTHFAYEEGLSLTQYLISKGLMAGLARPRLLPYDVTLALAGKTHSKEHKLVKAALKAAGPRSKRGKAELDKVVGVHKAIEELEAVLSKLEEK